MCQNGALTQGTLARVIQGKPVFHRFHQRGARLQRTGYDPIVNQLNADHMRARRQRLVHVCGGALLKMHAQIVWLPVV